MFDSSRETDPVQPVRQKAGNPLFKEPVESAASQTLRFTNIPELARDRSPARMEVEVRDARHLSSLLSALDLPLAAENSGFLLQFAREPQWRDAMVEREIGHGLEPVIATNVKFFGDYIDRYHIRIVRTISDIFDVVADIDLKGERRNLYCFIDEFDGAEGQNAWETRGKEAGAAFRVFNQMRKTQEIILVPSIHYPQDVNNRWRESLQGVHCVLNKGKYYPPQGQKN